MKIYNADSRTGMAGSDQQTRERGGREGGRSSRDGAQGGNNE